MGTSNKEESEDENVESEQSRWFFVGMAVFLIVVAVTGFWPTYFGSLFIGQVPIQFGAVEISLPVHIHTAIFMGWLFLLLTQTVLISKDHTQTHTKIGTYGMIFGLLIFAVGLIMTYVQMESAVAKEFASWSEAPFLAWRSFFSISQFATLLALGYIYRSSPEWHKRYMILATVAIVQAATSRMRIFLGPWGMEIMFVFLVGPLFIYDYYKKKRIHPATLIGSAIVASFFVMDRLIM